jgi:creatinine amidohydrolase
MLKYWEEMTSADFAGIDDHLVAILPVAATEQHGPHLPTGTDRFILDGILNVAAKVAGPTRGILLPLQAIGWSSEHGDLPGTLSLDPELLAASWVALGEAVGRTGLSRLLILNSHGGNPPAMAIAAMRLRTGHGMFVAQTHWEALARPDQLAPQQAPLQDWHAGWVETSMMLYLRPDLVALDRATPGEMCYPSGLAPDGPAPWAWMTTDLSPNGIIGDPRTASTELGALLLERSVAGLARLLEHMAAAPWPPTSKRDQDERQ